MEGKLLPRLRFAGFSEEWQNLSLKEIALKIKDGTHFSPKTFKTGEFKYLTSKNVKNGYLDFSNLEYISKVDHQKIYSSSDVKLNDILLTKDGTIGQCCVNTLDEEFSLLSSVAFIRVKNDFSNYFVYQLLVSDIGQREIKKAIAGQALKRITLSKINDFNFNYPSLPEQEKIAAYLSSIDEKISLLIEKKKGLSRYKKAMMQQLFSQQIRFKDENGNDFANWEHDRLDMVCNIVGGGTPDTSDHKYWNGEINWFTPTEINSKYLSVSKRKISELGLKKSSAKLLKKGTVLFTSRATIGECGILMNDATTNQGFQSLVSINNTYNEFLYYWTQYKKNTFLKLSSGSTFLEISKTEMAKIIFSAPCFEEQLKIANFLAAIDESIDKVNEQIKQTKNFKKAMLQQMFV